MIGPRIFNTRPDPQNQSLSMNFKLLLLTLFCSACQNSLLVEPEHLIGEWKADSLYSFENGFQFMHTYLDTGPSYIYAKTGKVSEEKDGLKREFLYEIQGTDSLMLKAPNDSIMARYQIVELSKTHLALKKNKKPWLAGKNQKMYNILYLSKHAEDL